MSAFDAYVQAAFHGTTMPGGPTFTVVHDAETPLARGYADSIAEFFRKGPAAGTSAHAMAGPEKAVKLLPDNVVAWAAGPKANPHGWHLEQAGYARFTRPQWLTDLGQQQIGRVAGCLREVHDQWGIPKRWMTDDQLRRAAAGDRASGGMTTHQQVARVLGGTTHTDPEDNYPRDLLLQAVLNGDDMPNYLDWRQQDKEALVSDFWKGLGIHPRSGVAGDDGKETSPLDQLLYAAARTSQLPDVNALLDTPIDRTDVGRGPTTLRAILVWSDNHVDALASAIAAAASAGPVDAAAVRQLVQDAVNDISIKITAS